MSLQRVRPQIEDDYSSDIEEEDEDELMDDDTPPEEDDDDDDESDQDQDGSEDEEGEDGGESELEEPATTALSKISFGTLSKAASSLQRATRPHPQANPTSTVATAIKAQLSALKSSPPTTTSSNEARKPKPRSELKRASKHAPQEVSSKRAVTRRREVVEPLVPAGLRPRDPRFDGAVKGVFDDRVFRRNYEFLDGYREEEVKVLRREMEREKNPRRKGEMERTVRSMESRKQQQQQKARSEELLREHKKKEREMIKQGKKPFYLKKTEQKKMLLMDKYNKLNPKQLDKAIERKRKRKAQKEHKNIPYARREA